ncbi:hypothetical protein SAMN04487975_1245 [Planococcus glaciei]|uniref:hypothetical protein n=1 Tax=Planococcus glaciei TaxID=459472 RepID=UPI00088524D6|nr:hypothetical protein [Planococcus glaciei]SDI64260.1 hypothetical protein SAMN04487975_1245 [Planococcus glaciei]
MDSKDAIIADLAIYAMKQIQLAKADRVLTGNYDYWTGEMQSMKYLLLHMDKLLAGEKQADPELLNLVKFFEIADKKRKTDFKFLIERIWEEEIPEED